MDDDGLAAGAHVAVDLVANLDPKLSLIPVKRQLTIIHHTSCFGHSNSLFSRGYGSRELADPILAGAG